MKEKIGAVLIVILLAFVGALSFGVFYRLFFAADSNVSVIAYAAFLGAFFAFLFVRIGDFLKSYSDRKSRNYNALMKIERVLNSSLNTLSDNIGIISLFEDTYAKFSAESQSRNVFTWASRLEPVQEIGELSFDLLNLDLINELFAVNIHLVKLNGTMKTIDRAYCEMKDSFLGNRITTDNYLEGLKTTKDNLQLAKRFSVNLYRGS